MRWPVQRAIGRTADCQTQVRAEEIDQQGVQREYHVYNSADRGWPSARCRKWSRWSTWRKLFGLLSAAVYPHETFPLKRLRGTHAIRAPIESRPIFAPNINSADTPQGLFPLLRGRTPECASANSTPVTSPCCSTSRCT
jgi:hypothetical protein